MNRKVIKARDVMRATHQEMDGMATVAEAITITSSNQPSIPISSNWVLKMNRNGRIAVRMSYMKPWMPVLIGSLLAIAAAAMAHVRGVEFAEHHVHQVRELARTETLRGHGAVLLASLVDLDLRDGRNLLLLLDVVGDALRVLQTLNQLHVRRNVALGRRQAVQNVVLQLLHLDLERVLLGDEVRPELGQVGALLLDDHGQQLVLQARLRDGKVDQRRLGLNLGRVVGVGQLGVQVQPKVLVELHLLEAQT